MRLTDLNPRWLTKDGKRVGFAFLSPTDPGRKNWMTCLFVTMARHDQWDLWRDNGLQGIHGIQGVQEGTVWTCTPPIEEATFENISCSPSIDGSPAGNWHGYITNGNIVGGV